MLHRIVYLLCVFLSIPYSLLASDTENSPVLTIDRPIRIAVSVTPLSAPFFIAQDLGLFKSQGLNVHLLPCVGGVECSTMLFNERVELATFSESVVMFQSFKRDDFSIISTFVRSDNDVKLLTLQRSGIQKVYDINGKRVGVVKASASEFFLDSMLISHAMPYNSVEKVFLKPEQLNNALISGLVDAISVWEPWSYQLYDKEVGEVIDLSFRGVYNLSFNLCTLNSALERYPDQYTKIIRTLAQSIDWINDNQDLAKAILAKRLNADRKQIDHVWDSYAFRLSLSNSLLSELQLQARWAQDQNLVSGKVPHFRDFINSQFLQAVNQETQVMQ